MRIGTDIVEIARITKAIINGEMAFFMSVFILLMSAYSLTLQNLIMNGPLDSGRRKKR